MSWIRTSGDEMDAGYTPTLGKDVATKEYVDSQLAGYTGNSEFLTVASDIPQVQTGAPFLFQFRFLGNQNTGVFLEGYTGASSLDPRTGVWTIPNPVEGTYSMTAYLGEFATDVPGTTYDTLEFTFVVASVATDIQFASAPVMPSFRYGENALFPVELVGTGPVQLSLKSGSLQAGVALVTTQLLTPAQAAISITLGNPSQEGAGAGVVVICAVGASGVTASATASVSDVLRDPTWVGLSQLPIFPSSGSGSYALTQFIRGYPAPSLTVDPVMSTFLAPFTLSSYAIGYTSALLSAQGQTSTDFNFTLANTASATASIVLQLRVESAAVLPLAGTVFSWSRANQPATASGAEITFIDDGAQGAALRMRKEDGFTGASAGPLWDATNEALLFRTSARSTLGGLGVDSGLYPHAVSMRIQPKATTPTGTRQLYGSSSQFGYIDVGVTAGATSSIGYISSVRTIKTGGAPSATSAMILAFSISAQPQGVVVFVNYVAPYDTITGVTISSASSGGTTVPLAKAAEAYAVSGTTQAWFLGSSIPVASPLWVTVQFPSSTGLAVGTQCIALKGNQDLRVVNAKAISGTVSATNPTLTLSYSGVNCIGVCSITTGLDAVATDLSENANMTRLTTTWDNGTEGAGWAMQTTPGSANFVMSYSASANWYAMVGLAIGEQGTAGASTHRLAIGTSILAPTSAIAAASLYDKWSSVIFSHRTATNGAIRQDGTTYSVSSDGACNLLNNFYLGGATGVDFDLRALRVHYGAFDIAGSQGDAEVQWLSAQDAQTPAPSISTPVVTAITDTDPRLTHVVNAYRDFSWHTAGNAGAELYIIGGPGAHQIKLYNINETAGLKSNGLGGTASSHLVYSKVTGAGLLDTGREYIQLQVSNASSRYNVPTEGTTRVGLGGSYQNGFYNVILWQGYDLVLDSSMYALTGYNATFNISIEGIHHVNVPGITGTPFTVFLQPNAAGTATSLRITVRRHPVVGGALDTTSREEIVTILTQYPLTAGKRYLFVYRFKLDGSLAGTGFLQFYVREDATWLNAGNPVYTYAGRLGYQLADQRIEMRPQPHVYNWASQFGGSSAFPLAVNNIILNGEKGFRLWNSKGIALQESSLSGYPTVSRLSVAGFLDSLSA